MPSTNGALQRWRSELLRRCDSFEWSSMMGPTDIPRDPTTEAHASIRGYVHQLIRAVEFLLEEGELVAVVVEAFEDIVAITSRSLAAIQVRDRADAYSITQARSCAMLDRWALESAGRPELRFVFLSTQAAGNLHDSSPAFGDWVQGKRDAATRNKIRASLVSYLARPKVARFPALEKVLLGEETFAMFWARITWELCADPLEPRFAALVERAGSLVGTADARTAASAWLGEMALSASSPEIDHRTWTRQRLTRLIQPSRAAVLAEYLLRADTSDRDLLILDELQTLRRLLAFCDTTVADRSRVLSPGTGIGVSSPSPAALLLARHAIVPFSPAGRSQIVESLATWCESVSLLAVRLIVGDGGTGKTRLMIEHVRRMTTTGWEAGFLDRNQGPRQLTRLLASCDQPLLIVIDYAEMRDDLAELLGQLAREPSRNGSVTRVVLLARNCSDWWTALKSTESTVAELLEAERPTSLPPLSCVGNTTEREAQFRLAYEAFASTLNRAAPVSPRMPPLDDARFDRVLYVHMAALATVFGIEFSASDIMERVLDHEQRFWLTRLPADVRVRPESRLLTDPLRRMVAALTLLGGAPSTQCLNELIDRVEPALRPESRLLLRDLYPLGAAGVAPLEPDLLGEAMVLRTLRDHPEPVAFLCAIFDGKSPATLRRGFEVLGHISEYEPELAAPWIREVLARDPCARSIAVFEAAKAVGSRTAHSVLGLELEAALRRFGNSDLAGELSRAGLPNHTNTLAGTCAWIEEWQLSQLPEELATLDGPGLWARASVAQRLSGYLRVCGQFAEATRVARIAVDAARELAHRSPCATSGAHVTFSTADMATGGAVMILADCLGMLGTALNNEQRFDEAVTVLHEAASVCLRVDTCDESVAARANYLSCLGIAFRGLKKPDEQICAMAEAVDHLRRKLTSTAGEHDDILASALNNLGLAYLEKGRWGESLPLLQEALELMERIVESDAEAGTSDLVGSLNNVSLVLHKRGDLAGAIRFQERAVAIRRRLANVRLVSHGRGLAGSLGNLGGMYRRACRVEEALRTVTETIDVLDRLAAAGRPDAIARLQEKGNRAGVLAELGRNGEARQEVEESIVEARRLYATDTKYAWSLGVLLHELAQQLASADELERAVGILGEAVALFRTAANPADLRTLKSELIALTYLVRVQSTHGAFADAAATAREAVRRAELVAKSEDDELLGVVHEAFTAAIDAFGAGRMHLEALSCARRLGEILKDGDPPKERVTWLFSRLSELACEFDHVCEHEAAASAAELAIVWRGAPIRPSLTGRETDFDTSSTPSRSGLVWRARWTLRSRWSRPRWLPMDCPFAIRRDDDALPRS